MNKHTSSVSLIDGHIEEMTDAEIRKALEYKSKVGCELCDLKPDIYCQTCNTGLLKQALDLINRQKAEIERLQKLLSGAKDCIDEIEYAMNKVGTSNDRIDEALEEWNNLVKEMMEKGRIHNEKVFQTT